MKKKAYVALVAVILVLGVLFIRRANNTNVNNKSKTPSYQATSEEISEVQGDLGDSITSCKFYLDGKVYTAPLNVSEFISEGWKLDEAATESVSSLQPGARTNATFMNTENEDYSERMGVSFYNNTEQEVALEEAPIASVDLSKSAKMKVILPKGITWESTMEDAIAAYGDAEDSWTTGDRSYLIYSAKNGEDTISINLAFDKKDKGVSMLTEVKFQ